MILLPGLLLLSILVPRTETVACVRGTDYGNGDCVEAQCSPMDRLSAERYCRKYGGILYSNKNQFDVSMISYAMDTECGENSQVWLGITCINEKTCHNDRGQVIEILKNFTAFDEPITKPCVYMSLNNSLEKGRWFVSSCRNQIAKRPFLCWYTNDTNDPGCQLGTFFYKNRCYGLHGVQDPIAASDHCHNLGGELVSIHSENENEYIWDLAAELPSITANANFGIGLYVDMDKDLKWYDGSPVDYTNFEIPTIPPADGVYPPINSTITMDFTNKKWLADPTRGRLAQVCSWPPLSHDLQTVQATFPNLCPSGILPIESIIYSPDYPNYTSCTNCTLTYNGVFGKPIQIVFEEQYLDVGATIEIYTDRNDPQKVITIEYNTPITSIISSLSGYMKMVFKQPPGHLSYWRASTKTQGVRGQYPIKLGTPYVCNPDTIQPLSTDTYSQFQTPNYSANGGMSRSCTIIIMPQSASSTVVVSFYDFYLAPEDKVEVIDDTRTVLSGTQTGIMIEGGVGQNLTFIIHKVSLGFRGIWADFTSN